MGKTRAWRKEVKKIRRKRMRQKIAAERDKKLKEEEERLLNDPVYKNWLKEQEILEQYKIEEEQRRRDDEEEKWLRQELLAQKRFREELKKRKDIEKVKEEERLRIQREFEEQQKLVRERLEEKRRLAEEKQRKHELLLEKIQDYIDSDCPMPEELNEAAETNPGKEICPFFTKTASCRFGDKCSRNHSRPGISKILLLPHFFNHIRLDQSKMTEYGSDLALEFSDAELYRDFVVFFEDVVPELEKFGRLENFRACNNCEPHLRGNVYVEYLEERDALRAYMKLQGRYYARKRINVEFAKIPSWKAAICGLSLSRKCPKGKNCNFLHIFRNPQNKYNASLYPESSNRSERLDPKKEKNSRESPSWNSFDEESSQRRNWRWSETPERFPKENNLSPRNHSLRHSKERTSRHRKRKTRSRSRSGSFSKKPEIRTKKSSSDRNLNTSNYRKRTISKDRNSSSSSSTIHSSTRTDHPLLTGRDDVPRKSSKTGRKTPENRRRKQYSVDQSREKHRNISKDSSASSDGSRTPKKKRTRKKKKKKH